MTRKHATAAIVVTTGLLLLSGCATIYGFPDPPSTSAARFPDAGYQLGPAAITQYNNELDPAKKRILRNEIIDARMAEIDSKFANFERALYKEGIGFGVGTDWLVLALTAGATTAGGVATKTLLAAISTAVLGAEAAYSKHALFDKTLPVLMAQMVAQRETIRVSIRTNQDLPTDAYTWFAAESQLNNFEFAGSIPGAIASVAADAGQKAAAATQQLQDIRLGRYQKTKAGDLIQGYWKPGGVVNQANQTAIMNWMKDNGLSTDPGMITVFIKDADLEAKRTQAAKDLGLPK
jgi:hypothetical protein